MDQAKLMEIIAQQQAFMAKESVILEQLAGLGTYYQKQQTLSSKKKFFQNQYMNLILILITMVRSRNGTIGIQICSMSTLKT